MEHQDENWNRAWLWLKTRRKQAPHNSDIWHLRYHWSRLGPQIWQQVQSGSYRLSPARIVRGSGAGRAPGSVVIWSASDALVLKWAALTVRPGLDVHSACLHLQGGVYRCVAAVAEQLRNGNWFYVYRTDIKGYYQNIRKDMAWKVWQESTENTACMNLVHQYLHYSTEEGGDIRTPQHGIPRACSLSPLTGAILLGHMDRHFSNRKAWFYVRYMDDFLILTEKRWPLRRAIADLNQYLNSDGFNCHPDKTQTGRLTRGFDWCGVQFGDHRPRISDRSLLKHRDICLRLYEQLIGKGLTEREAHARVQRYVARWTIWADGLLRAAEG